MFRTISFSAQEDRSVGSGVVCFEYDDGSEMVIIVSLRCGDLCYEQEKKKRYNGARGSSVE